MNLTRVSSAPAPLYSESVNLNGLRLEAVADRRDSALTEYVRSRIREWESSGSDQLELARRVGCSAATISQVKTKTGVGSRTVDGFAKAFGFRDASALRAAAYQWFLAQGGVVAVLLAEPAVISSMVTVLGLRAGITEAQLRTILYAFGHERFQGRDESFWVPTLLEELAQESRVAEAQRNSQHQAASAKRTRKSKIEGALRAGHRRRKAPKHVQSETVRSRKQDAG